MPNRDQQKRGMPNQPHRRDSSTLGHSEGTREQHLGATPPRFTRIVAKDGQESLANARVETRNTTRNSSPTRKYIFRMQPQTSLAMRCPSKRSAQHARDLPTRRRHTNCWEKWRDLQTIDHKSPGIAHTTAEAWRRETAAQSLPKETNDAHTREPWLLNDVMSILTTDHAAPGAPTLGQSVSKIISQISRVTSDPVPSNRSMEITTSVEFASKSDHFHVALRLPALQFPLLWMSSSNDGARRGLYNASSHGLEHWRVGAQSSEFRRPQVFRSVTSGPFETWVVLRIISFCIFFDNFDNAFFQRRDWYVMMALDFVCQNSFLRCGQINSVLFVFCSCRQWNWWFTFLDFFVSVMTPASLVRCRDKLYTHTIVEEIFVVLLSLLFSCSQSSFCNGVMITCSIHGVDEL